MTNEENMNFLDKKILKLDDLHKNKYVEINSFIKEQYQIKELIGKGAFGLVHKLIDTETNNDYALKIYTRNSGAFLECINNEIEILRIFNDDPCKNIIKCIGKPWIYDTYWCFMYELLDINLYNDLKRRKFKGYKYNNVKTINNCLIEALNHLYKHNIIHADLKPENIVFINSNDYNVKIIDFGSSFIKDTKQHKHTNYIQSRYYRSIEIFRKEHYGLEIDMWSLGCIIYELFTGSPLLPGINTNDQYNMIVEYTENPTILISKLNNIGDYEDAIDYIVKCLEWKQHLRLNPIKAKEHDFYKII